MSEFFIVVIIGLIVGTLIWWLVTLDSRRDNPRQFRNGYDPGMLPEQETSDD